MAARVKVEGLKEIEAALGNMKKATARNVLVRALKPRADTIRDAMKAGAPVDQGALRDGIVTSPKVPGKVDPGKAAYAEAMRNSGGDKGLAGQAMRDARRANPSHFARVFVGVSGKRKALAHLVEWGTASQPGTRFATQAWDREGGGLLDGLSADIKAEIDKAAVREARKAARLLAKAKL